MKIVAGLKQLLERASLSAADMQAIMREIMSGEASPAQIAGFLIALNMKGETVEEIAAAASVMREFSARIELGDGLSELVVDTCGTGGDASGLFNVSTASAIAVAAAGGKVAKHGNRAASSKSGSADVLEAAGVRIDLPPEAVATCVQELGIGFLFAQTFHPAMKHAIGPRREMGVRTIFNLLGPLTNPAGARYQVLGVFSADWVEPLAHVLGELGSRHVLVVHGQDGLDEVSLSAPTEIAELADGQVRSYTVEPEQFGLARCQRDELVVGDAQASLQMIRRAFAGERCAAADMIALNAGAALYAAGLTDDWNAGVARIRGVLEDGSADQKLDALARRSQELA